MNARRIVLVWLLAGCVSAVLVLQGRELREQSEAAKARSTPLVEAIEDEQVAVTLLTRQIEGLEADIAKLRASAESANKQSQNRGAADADFFERQARLAQLPEYQLAELELRRAELRLNNAALYRKLKLNADQIAGFEAAEARHEEQKQDLVAAAKLQEIDVSDPSLAALWEKIAKERFEAHKEFLGEEGAKAWRDHDRLRQARQLVEGVAGAAAIAGVPVNPVQAEGLMNAIAATGGRRTVVLSRVDWSVADAQARALLSPEQFRIYQSVSPVEGTSRQLLAFSAAMRKALEAEGLSLAGNK